jgi:hypothetical protein
MARGSAALVPKQFFVGKFFEEARTKSHSYRKAKGFEKEEEDHACKWPQRAK